MTETPASRALGACIEDWWNRVRPGSGDCRVVVPAPTLQMGMGVHRDLMRRGIPSYFVTSGRHDSPATSEERRILRAEAVTSIRDGSFAVIVEPGELSKLQESIQGSGGGIRGLAIPDEWPWAPADSGFDFFVDFFPRWAALTNFPGGEVEMASRLLEIAIEALETTHQRAQVLFDEVLARSFHDSQSADAFALAVGVPSIVGPSVQGPGVPIASMRDLSGVRKVVDAMQGSNARIAVEQNSHKVFEELLPADRPASVEELRKLLDAVLDRMRTRGTGKGPLALRSALPDSLGKWRLLTLPLLRRIFLEEATAAQVALAARWSEGPRAYVLSGGHHCVTPFRGQIPTINVQVERSEGAALIEAKAGRRKVGEVNLPAGTTDGEIQVDAEMVNESTAITVAAFVENAPRVACKLHIEQPKDDNHCFLAVAEPARDGSTVKSVRRIEGQEGGEDREAESVDVDGGTSLYFVCPHGQADVSLDGGEVEIDEVSRGVFRVLVDVGALARLGVQPELTCASGDTSVVVPLSVQHRKGGACNLEVALADAVDRGAATVPKLLGAWEGREDARALLGSPSEAHEKRFSLAREAFEQMEHGWKPVLLPEGVDLPTNLAAEGMVRLAEAHTDLNIARAMRNLTLSPTAQSLIDEYASARATVLDFVSARHGKHARGGLPLYAVASFHYKPDDELDQSIRDFLFAFERIQLAVAHGQHNFVWAEKFLLAHLDTVLLSQEDGSGWFPVGCAIGPWHPLVVAKRMMVGSGIQRLASLDARGPRSWLRRLTSLLHGVSGFRWFSVLLPHSSQPAPFFVEATDDPGWLIAHPALEAGAVQALESASRQAASLGLVLEGSELLESKGLKGYLADFLKAFPSRRALVVNAGSGTAGGDAAVAAREFLGTDAALTPEGEVLAGGVHILVDDDGGGAEDYPEWAEPVVCVYPRGGGGFRRFHKIDVNLCHAATAINYPVRPDSRGTRHGPRGEATASVLQLPFRALEETASQIRDTRLSYDTVDSNTRDDLGGCFLNAVTSAQLAGGAPREVGVRTLSPDIEGNRAVWTIFPGDGIDPAVLLEWTDRNTEDHVPRLLWDYRMSLARSSPSYFVLSEVPEMLVQRLAGSSVFRDRHRAGKALLELGAIGLALGSETFKSRSRALGVVGLVGAARLSQNVLAAACGEDTACRGFLLPVDSFLDVLGGDLDGKEADSDARRADLIGIACRLKDEYVELGFLSIESKYCSSTYGLERARSALSQARRSLERLEVLARAAAEENALAERLAFARLLEFGLRLEARHRPDFIAKVVGSVLRGQHRVGALGKTGCMVVATEVGANRSEIQLMDEGAWVRLTPEDWPGESGDVGALITTLADYFEPAWIARSRVAGTGGHPPLQQRPARSDTTGPVREQQEFSDHPKEPPRPQGEAAAESGVSQGVIPAVGGADDKTESSSNEGPQAAQGHGGAPSGAAGEEGKKSATQTEGLVQSRSKEPVAFVLGVDNAGHPVEWRAGLNANHNFMVTGTSGTGKTQLLKGIVWQARKQGLPALILDFKNDFAPDEAFRRGADMDVQFVAYQGLPYNPLIPCRQILPHTGRAGYPISQHINGLVSAFQKAYGLGEQQAADLKTAIRQAFDEVGMPSSSVVDVLPDAFPDFSAVGRHLREVNRLAYNRLDPLFDLEIFREEFREVPFDQLLGRGYVLDLSAIQSAPIQNTLAMLLVYSAHRYLNVLDHASSVEQLIIFDEAHRVLGSKDVEDLVRECRAYGLGVVLSSQFPTDFPSDTATNLATKVLHGNGPDQARIQAIRSMLGLSTEADAKLDLPIFHAVIRTRPGPACFARTIGFPHWLVMEALDEGPLTLEAVSEIEGLRAQEASAVIQHLVTLGLVTLKDGRVGKFH